MPRTNSRTRGPRIGQAIHGSLGKYILKEKIGAGGNGVVYSVVVEDQKKECTSIGGFALKVFVPNKDAKKRKKRFIEEIKFVQKNQKEIDGIIPILDSSLDIDSPKGKYLWYLMPKAEKYKYWEIQAPDRIIDDMLYVGNTLSILHVFHGKKYAHRDIKPDNLLLYNNKLCLSDFGLIWNDQINRRHITGKGEFLGPGNIRPPEMENLRNSKEVDFSFSDVYLFAKTLWIMLTANRRGFSGEYNRNNSAVLLDNTEIEKRTGVLIESLEPLHQLMEKSTYDYWEGRNNIESCVSLLKEQRRILNNTIDPYEMMRYKRLEIVNKARATRPDVYVYTDLISIESILMVFQRIRMQFRIQEKNNSYSFGDMLSVSNFGSSVFKISYLNLFGKKQVMYVKIQKVTITDSDNCIIQTANTNYSSDRIPTITHAEELFFSDEAENVFNGEIRIIL